MTFFAVFSPSLIVSQSEERIFPSLIEALKCVKELKDANARFKSFGTIAEALNYVQRGPEYFASISNNNNNNNLPGSPIPEKSKSTQNGGEKSFDFPAPSRPELSQLRKLIEKKDNEAVERMVWSNPRFLINCNSDSPTILFEGINMQRQLLNDKITKAEIKIH